MAKRRFTLDAAVDSDQPGAIEPVLEKLVGIGLIEGGRGPGEFHVKARVEGESAKDLNRSLLTKLRRAEKRTRLRAEWTADDGTVYRFFDYVLKKTSRP